MKIKSIIFDLDGTLLDTLYDIMHCANLTLQKYGFPEHPAEAYKDFIGKGAEVLMKRALPATEKDSPLFEEYMSEFKEIYREKGTDNAELYTGIAELLDTLTERDIKKSILSNKPHELTQIAVQQKLARWNFAPVFGSRQTVPIKPDPTGALEIMALQKVHSTNCLFVGDTPVDIHTARAASITSVGVLWGFRGENELKQAGASHLIQHPGELLDLLI